MSVRLKTLPIVVLLYAALDCLYVKGSLAHRPYGAELYLQTTALWGRLRAPRADPRDGEREDLPVHARRRAGRQPPLGARRAGPGRLDRVPRARPPRARRLHRLRSGHGRTGEPGPLAAPRRRRRRARRRRAPGRGAADDETSRAARRRSGAALAGRRAPGTERCGRLELGARERRGDGPPQPAAARLGTRRAPRRCPPTGTSATRRRTSPSSRAPRSCSRRSRSVSTFTLSSHVSMLTGVYPSHHTAIMTHMRYAPAKDAVGRCAPGPAGLPHGCLRRHRGPARGDRNGRRVRGLRRPGRPAGLRHRGLVPRARRAGRPRARAPVALQRQRDARTGSRTSSVRRARSSATRAPGSRTATRARGSA